MSGAGDLAEARAARDAARAVFDARLQRLRGDPEAESTGGHIAGRLGDDARSALHHALDVAGESKGIIAATLAALALWFLRHPIVAWVERQVRDDAAARHEHDKDFADDRNQ